MRLSSVDKCSQNASQNSFCNDVDDNIDVDHEIGRYKHDRGVETESASHEIQQGQFYRFLEDHPLYHSTHVTLLHDSEEYVPNFIGGAVPRSDHGDREYYCSTMLAFFRPWRTGKDLRSETQSWDEAFNKYQFTPRQQEIMKYFNVRYECLDARDDYAAQLKKGENIGIFANWDIYDNFEPHDINHTVLDGDNFGCDENIIDDDDTIGPITNKRNRDMAKVEEIMHVSGWFDESPDGPPDFGDLNPIIPDCTIPGKEWETVVQNKKQEVLNERSKNLPTRKNDPVSVQHLDEVKVVDKSYLNKNFKADGAKDQQFIDTTVKTLC
jgi:hypothetical protein